MPIWAQILVPVLTAVATLVATTITTHILNGPKKKKEERAKEINSILEKIEQLDRDIDEKLEIARNRSSQLGEDIALLKLGLQAIIKNELKSSYNQHIKKGYASVDVKEDLEKLYQVYHSLGQNGVLDDLHCRFMKLPISKGE